MRSFLFDSPVLGRPVLEGRPPGWVYGVLCWTAMADVWLGIARATTGHPTALGGAVAGLLGVLVLGCAWTDE